MDSGIYGKGSIMFRQDIKDIRDYKLNKSTDYTWGGKACALSCVFDLVEQLTCVYYSPKLAKLYAHDMHKHGHLDDNFLVHWNGCFYELGLIVDVRFEDADYICHSGEYEILELRKTGHTHFVRGDGKGNYSWDSLGIREAQKYYKISSKRIIRVVGER
jgi:hypothetical protein